jgi:hypothetical protein
VVLLVVSMLPVVVLLVKNPRRGQLGILVFSDHGGSAIDRFCLLEEDRAALVGGKQHCIYW